MSRLKVYDLATGTWQYAGGVNPDVLAADSAFSSRYAPAGLGVFGPGTPVAGTTSASVTSTVCTLVIPDQGKAGVLFISAMVEVQGATADDQVSFLVLQDGSAIVQPKYWNAGTLSTYTVTAQTPMPAGASKTITTAVDRFFGFGTMTFVADSRYNRIDVLFVPT